MDDIEVKKDENKVNLDDLIKRIEHRDNTRCENKKLNETFSRIYQIVKDDTNGIRKKMAIDLMLKMIGIEERKE
jgi:hypothetical protein